MKKLTLAGSTIPKNLSIHFLSFGKAVVTHPSAFYVPKFCQHPSSVRISFLVCFVFMGLYVFYSFIVILVRDLG